MERVEAGCGLRYLDYFSAFKWNYLPLSILEGHHGEVWVDRLKDPNVVILTLPKVKLYLLGGDANHPASRQFLRSQKGMAGFFPVSEDWTGLLTDVFGGRLWEMERYAYLSNQLDLDHLESLADKIPAGFHPEPIDLLLAEQLKAERSEFTEDHLVNFESPQDFVDHGFGWCLLEADQIVSVATTFLVCSQGIEIQINTREEYQRMGLATVVAARLMLDSLARGLIPNWDAANQKSGRLAEKLGCVPQGSYSMYVNLGSRLMVGLAKFGVWVKDRLGK